MNFLQSREYGHQIPIKELLKNTEFAFTHERHKGYRPHLVLPDKENEFNVVELCHDRWGIRVTSVSRFGAFDYNHMKKYIQKSGINDFIANYFIQQNAGEFINPKLYYFRHLRERFMASGIVRNIQYQCRRGLVFYENRKMSHNWCALQLTKGSPRPYFWHYMNNRPYKQWFAMFAIWPMFFNKNNSYWEFGINLIFFNLRLKYQF